MESLASRDVSGFLYLVDDSPLSTLVTAPQLRFGSEATGDLGAARSDRLGDSERAPGTETRRRKGEEEIRARSRRTGKRAAKAGPAETSRAAGDAAQPWPSTRLQGWRQAGRAPALGSRVHRPLEQPSLSGTQAAPRPRPHAGCPRYCQSLPGPGAQAGLGSAKDAPRHERGKGAQGAGPEPLRADPEPLLSEDPGELGNNEDSDPSQTLGGLTFGCKVQCASGAGLLLSVPHFTV